MRLYPLLIVFILIACIGTACADEQKKVLILHSYHKGFTWTDYIDEGINQVLGHSKDIELVIEYMDTKRTPPEALSPLLVELYRTKYKHTVFDAILTSDDNAFNFALETRDTLFPGVPIVFCGINNFTPEHLEGEKDITGIVETVDFLGGVNLALKLFPKVTLIAVISDVTETGDLHKKQFEKEVISKLSARVTFRKLYRLTAEQLKTELEALPENAVVFNLTYWRDPTGRSFNHLESNTLVAEASPVPVFTSWDHTLVYGILGGLTTNGLLQGKIAAKMVEKILGGTRVSDIDIVWKSPTVPMFDYDVMQKFGVRKQDLPAGSIVLNEPVSFYYKYKHIVWITLTFIFLQTIAIFLLIINIRKRKSVQRALADSEKRFRNFMEFSPIPVAITDSVGNMIFLNQKFSELLGYSNKDIPHINQWWPLAYPDPGYREETIQLWERAIENAHAKNDEIEPIERNVTCKDGRIRQVEFLYRPIGTLGITLLNDLTERYRDEEERRILSLQMQHNQRLESLGVLAGGIAHDFNNLLMGMQGRSSLLALNLSENDPQFEHLKAIDEYIRSAGALTRQLLGTAQGGKYDPRPCDLNELVQASSSMFGRTRKELKIRNKLASTPVTAEVDRQQIEQVLLNMYVNASQAMPEGGLLQIATSLEPLDEAICSAHQTTAGIFARISITDSGVGMDERTLQKIFDPFFTTKEKGRGTGLGLASAYGIIKNHDGFITAASEPGKGSTFDIYLPASREIPVAENHREDLILKGEEIILLVDDEQLILDVGQEMLKQLGYQVFRAQSGTEAIALAESKGNQIDLVILDLIMPGIDGEKTFYQLREMFPRLPIILSSGYAINDKASRIMKRGCNAFIQKPFSLSALSQKIRTTLDAHEQS